MTVALEVGSVVKMTLRVCLLSWMYCSYAKKWEDISYLNRIQGVMRNRRRRYICEQ